MRFFLFIAIILMSAHISAQKSAIIFYNQNEGKAVQLVKGTMVVIEYQGYLKQLELISNSIINLNDSTITLGKPQVFSSPKNTKKIKIKDIKGFRKISAGSQLLKTVLTVGATLGTYYAMRENGDDLSHWQELLFSTGAGLATRISLNLIFPDKKIKHRMKDSWKVIVR